jgi:hypothetical protein
MTLIISVSIISHLLPKVLDKTPIFKAPNIAPIGMSDVISPWYILLWLSGIGSWYRTCSWHVLKTPTIYPQEQDPSVQVRTTPLTYEKERRCVSFSLWLDVKLREEAIVYILKICMDFD